MVLDNVELLVHYYRHQQDALLTMAVNIQRFEYESTALTKRNNQSELWGVVKPARRDGKPPPSPELGNEPGQVFAAWQASAGV